MNPFNLSNTWLFACTSFSYVLLRLKGFIPTVTPAPAAGTYFANAKIPAIGCSCTNAAVTAGNDYYFRVCFLDPFQGSVMASFAMEEFGAKKAYVLSMLGDDYTVGLAKNFVIAFEAAGGEIVADETFVEGTADFSAYLNNAVCRRRRRHLRAVRHRLRPADHRAGLRPRRQPPHPRRRHVGELRDLRRAERHRHAGLRLHIL